jgi:hypothetical protein
MSGHFGFGASGSSPGPCGPITRQLSEAGRLLDMPVHDHIIVGNGADPFMSFADRGILG